MFFRKAAAKGATTAQSTHADGESGSDDAVDALGDVLRTYGEQNLETEEEVRAQVAAVFARWANHVLVGQPVKDGGESGRDFRGAVRAFRAQRKAETERVTRALGDLRSAVWAFITVLSRAAFADGRTDGAMRERLTRLQAVVERGDHSQLRVEAQGTVADLTSLIQERATAQKARMAELANEVRRLGRELEEAKREGETDGLTKLFNRACFDRFAERTAGLAMLGTPSSLLLIDVDHFKKVNDAYGHPTGDGVLRAVADAIFRTFPRRDDLVARYGGEEFAVILRNTRRADAELLAERLLKAIRAIEVKVDAGLIKPTASAGVAELVASENVAEWLARADAALYRAKAAGRNRWMSAV